MSMQQNFETSFCSKYDSTKCCHCSFTLTVGSKSTPKPCCFCWSEILAKLKFIVTCGRKRKPWGEGQSVLLQATQSQPWGFNSRMNSVYLRNFSNFTVCCQATTPFLQMILPPQFDSNKHVPFDNMAVKWSHFATCFLDFWDLKASH